MKDAVLVHYPWLESDRDRVLTQDRQGRMHHALILQGPGGLGKLALARWLLAARLCLSPAPHGPCLGCRSCQLLQAQTHPDYLEIQPEKAGGQIGIDAVREAIDFIHKTPSISGHKGVLLSPAEALNVASANALLKILEEPTGDASLILAGRAIHRLPATIISRCQLQVMRIPERREVLPWLMDQSGVQEGEALGWLDACGGAPLDALHNGAQAVKIGTAVSGDLDALSARKTDPLTVAAHWAGMDVVLCLQAMWRYLLARQQQALDNRAPAAASLAESLRDVVEALRVLDRAHTNPNQQLLLEELLIACGSRLALE
ncbi:MAG TPA: hypothetical protein VIM96_10690 [Pseudomonadales bacterium]